MLILKFKSIEDMQERADQIKSKGIDVKLFCDRTVLTFPSKWLYKECKREDGSVKKIQLAELDNFKEARGFFDDLNDKLRVQSTHKTKRRGLVGRNVAFFFIYKYNKCFFAEYGHAKVIDCRHDLDGNFLHYVVESIDSPDTKALDVADIIRLED